MSVIGIDIGQQTSYIAIARQGGIETIANEYSDRCTPTCVSMSDKNRFIGASAKNQMITNYKNTIWGWKKLIGQSRKDVQHELSQLPYDFVEERNGSIGIQVSYLNEKRVFSPEQFTAMMLTKLKETAEHALNSKVVDCVIAVPCYFTDVQRRVLLNAAHIVGLNVLRLMNDTTATALTYGIYKEDLPAVEEKPRNVIFVDMGHSSLQLSVCSLNKGKLKMLATTADPNLGGSNFDRLLADYFVEDFNKRYKMNIKANPRAYLRLLQECEKLKKLMSANSQEIPLNIECFLDDIDVQGKMCRETMEQMAAPLLQALEHHLKQLLQLANLQTEDIYAVEIVGGSTRVSSVKELIRRVYGKDASTTLNSDESVARGCALQCAILSPSFRVRDFSISDAQYYPIQLISKSPTSDEMNKMEIFSLFATIPGSRMVTFYRQEPFTLEIYYDSPLISKENSLISKFIIKDVKPTANGEPSKVKVKVRINMDGLLTVSSATLNEKIDTPDEPEVIEEVKQNGEGDIGGNPANVDAACDAQQQQQQQPQQPMDQSSTATTNGEVAGNADVQNIELAAEKVKKQKVKVTDLPITSLYLDICQMDVNKYMELENEMIMQDKQEKERGDAKNAVEEYVYEMRTKVSETLGEFMRPADKDSFLQLLESTEQWLYDEGEEEKKQVYTERLVALKKIGDPVMQRYNEAMYRPAAFEAFAHSLQMISKAVQAYLDKDEKYAHLEPADIEKVKVEVVEKQAWFDKHANMQISPYEPPPFTIASIKSQLDSLNSLCNSILNKPKPKPKEEPPKTKEVPKTGKDNAEKQENKTEHKTANQNKDGDVNHTSVPEVDMDLD